MIKAAIFDMDGTLIDSVDQHAMAWRDVFREFGCEVDLKAIRDQIGKGGDELMPVFLSQEDIDARGSEIETRRGEIFRKTYLPTVKPFPQVRELFQKLIASGVHVALASSAKSEELETYKKIAGVDDLVETETSSGDVERSKPHPDIFEAAVGRLKGVSAAESIALGDTPYDAQSATKAGVRTIGVLSGGWPEAELKKAGCFAVYRDAADLLANFDASPFGAGAVPPETDA